MKTARKYASRDMKYSIKSNLKTARHPFHTFRGVKKIPSAMKLRNVLNKVVHTDNRKRF